MNIKHDFLDRTILSLHQPRHIKKSAYLMQEVITIKQTFPCKTKTKTKVTYTLPKPTCSKQWKYRKLRKRRPKNEEQSKTLSVRNTSVAPRDVHRLLWRLIGDLNDHMGKHRLSHNIPGNAKIWLVSENPHENCRQNKKKYIRPPVYRTLVQGRIRWLLNCIQYLICSRILITPGWRLFKGGMFQYLSIASSSLWK